MIITTKLDLRMYQELMFKLNYRRPMMILLTILGIIMFITAILYFLGLPIPFNETPYFPIFFGIFTMLLPLFIYISSKKNFSSYARLHEQIIYEFKEDKILMTGESFKAEMDWTKLYRIDELSNWMLIYQNKTIANVIPKTSFGDKLGDFKKLVISKKIESRFKK